MPATSSRIGWQDARVSERLSVEAILLQFEPKTWSLLAPSPDMRQQWRDYVREVAATGDWDRIIDSIIDRVDRPALLFDLIAARYVDDAVLRDVLPGVWSAAEWPEVSLTRRFWIRLFRRAAYPPPPRLTVYRGAVPRYVRGMAWTTDRDKADWFARRWTISTGRPAFVYVAEAPPEAVLADIDALDEGGRGEHEIVVDPSLLLAVRRL